MSQKTVIDEAAGLQTQPNELKIPPGGLAVCENMEITRDGVIEVAKGFADYSENLPNFRPEQLFSFGGELYAHVDNGLWWFDGTRWMRKRGRTGGKLSNPICSVIIGSKLYFTQIHCVCELDIVTGKIRVIAGRQGISGTSNGTGPGATFNAPTSICTNNDQTSLFVCDSSNHAIREVVIATGVVTTFSGLIGSSGSTDSPTPRYSSPTGICFDGTDFYVSDTGNHTVRKLTTAGVLTTFAGTAGASGTTDGTGSAARFNLPGPLCAVGGSLYICDYNNDVIRTLTIPGAVSATITGAVALGPGGTVGVAGAAVYVAHTNRIYLLTPPSTYAFVAGQAGSGSADGIGDDASFSGITGLSHYPQDNALIVCDSSNNLIRKVYLDTMYVATIAGHSGESATFNANAADGIVAGPT